MRKNCRQNQHRRCTAKVCGWERSANPQADPAGHEARPDEEHEHRLAVSAARYGPAEVTNHFLSLSFTSTVLAAIRYSMVTFSPTFSLPVTLVSGVRASSHLSPALSTTMRSSLNSTTLPVT